MVFWFPTAREKTVITRLCGKSARARSFRTENQPRLKVSRGTDPEPFNAWPRPESDGLVMK